MKDWKMKHFGSTLKRLRKSRNLTQEGLALKSQLGPKTISLLETDQQEPLLSTLWTLAKSLGMAPSELMREIEKDVRKTQLLEMQPK